MVQTFEPEGQNGVDSNITAGNDSNEEAPVSRTDTTVISYTIGGGGISDRCKGPKRFVYVYWQWHYTRPRRHHPKLCSGSELLLTF